MSFYDASNQVQSNRGWRAGRFLRPARVNFQSRSLSDLKNRSENSAGRGQISPIFWLIAILYDQKIGEIWTVQADLQPISFKSDRLLEYPPPFLPQLDRTAQAYPGCPCVCTRANPACPARRYPACHGYR